MTSSNTISRTVAEIIYSVLRKTNDYEDGSEPETSKVEEVRLALMELLARWEAKLEHHYTSRFRTLTFEDPSVVLEGGTYYRCYRGFTSYDASTWQATTAYVAGDYVLPTTANGYVYKCTTAGTSGGTESTFPEYQRRTVTDSSVTWEAVPDNKPGEGLNWTTYFVEDGSQTSGSSWSYNEQYYSPGDFTLTDDEYDILSAYYTYQQNEYDLEKKSYNEIGHCTEEGVPSEFAIENTGTYTKVCHIKDIPQETGADGYILHYEARIRNLKYDGSDDSLVMPDVLYSALIFQLCADVADESQVPEQTIMRWEAKARELLREALDSLSPYDRAGFIEPCYPV